MLTHEQEHPRRQWQGIKLGKKDDKSDKVNGEANNFDENEVRVGIGEVDSDIETIDFEVTTPAVDSDAKTIDFDFKVSRAARLYEF